MPTGMLPIERVNISAYVVPTDGPEEDGTFCWDRTTVVVAEIKAAGKSGLGYSYASAAAASVARDVLAPFLIDQDAFAIPRLWRSMLQAVRNIGSRGVCANAISALDVALWDLKARALDAPLARLFGPMRDTVPIYGSGGFTNYDNQRLAGQLGTWTHEDGCRWVKIKIGRDPESDPGRMRVARDAIGAAELMVDANGALDRKKAVSVGQCARDFGVTWFEEPVSSDDLEGLSLVRKELPAPIEVAAGEYGYDLFYFRHMMEKACVDVIQADATRCCGYTGFLAVASLADAQPLPLSAHTAPALHLPVCCAAPRLRHIEWFHDHARIERMLFDGAPKPKNGAIRPDLSRPGHGLELKRGDAAQFAI